MRCSLLGVGPALVAFSLLRPKRRVWIPLLCWWLYLILGSVIGFYGMFHSTVPSFSNRITNVGHAYDYVKREIYTGYHHNSIYGFRFVPDSGEPIQIETEIILPDTALPTIFDGQTFRVVYLADDNRVLKNEAVDIEILSGENAGFHHSLDARPLGAWLAIPFGFAFVAFGFAGLRNRKSDAIAASSEENVPSAS
jgi:hypothetical protein